MFLEQFIDKVININQMKIDTNEEYIKKLAQKLDIEKMGVEELRKSFIHRSYLNENHSEGLESNERLEFLGDAVLEVIVTKYLFNNFRYPEGELTALRSALVRGKNLSNIAEMLGLDKCIYLSEGEKKNEGKARSLILANTFEALIGNIYLCLGVPKSEEIINKYVISKLNEIIENKLYIDNKSAFQEIVQSKTKITPVYKLIKDEGPDHSKEFTVGVYIGDELVAVGTGSSKNKAEQEAAREAIKKKFN